MSLSAAMMQALLDAGATPEMLVRAAEAEERRIEDRDERKRELNRERQARWRQRQKDEESVTPVTRDKRNERDSETKPAAKSKPKGCRVDGYEPDIAVAVSLGLSEERAKLQAAKFLDYWRSKPGQAGVKLDWLATWRNWIRSEIERNGSGHLRVVNGSAPTKPRRTGDRLFDLMNPPAPSDERTIDEYARRR
ncbi:hypothetical protein [Roseibium sp.]|uniref:hypothetical protein n=1 Tax=Roseibium sp. TaxID=1936156 RepID=UPI00329014B2